MWDLQPNLKVKNKIFRQAKIYAEGAIALAPLSDRSSLKILLLQRLSQ